MCLIGTGHGGNDRPRSDAPCGLDYAIRAGVLGPLARLAFLDEGSTRRPNGILSIDSTLEVTDTESTRCMQ